MALSITEADLGADRGRVIAFLRENLTPLSDDGRFDWLYLQNPFGRAKVWIATETGNGEDRLVGTAAAFPRLLHVRGEPLLGWNLGDFAVHRQHRSLGLALRLQRACLEQIDSGEVPFCYDHPSATMMAIYRRLGVPATGEVVRYVRLLRVDHKVREVIPWAALSRPVSALGNAVLSRRRRGRVRNDLEVSLHEGPFGEEFSVLYDDLRRRHHVIGARTSEYLDWKYRSNPLARYDVLVARSRGELKGYLVFTQEQSRGVLVDLFGESDSELVTSLTESVSDLLRERGAESLNYSILESHPMIPAIRRAGFHARESAPFVAHARQGSSLAATLGCARNWYLTYGDRDI